MAGVFLFSSLVVHAKRMGGDDAKFPKLIQQHDLIGWVVHRADTWSGRFFAEAYIWIFGMLPIAYWMIAGIVQYAIFTTYLFLYCRLGFAIKSGRQMTVVYLLAALCLYLIPKATLVDSAFWVTGAMNYFWIVVAGLVAIYPIAHKLAGNSVDRRVEKVLYVLGLTGALVAGSSQEQVAVATVSVASMLTLLIYLKTKQFHFRSVSITLVSIAALLLSYFSPGNKLRLVQSAANRIPDFYDMPILYRANYSARWFIDTVINHTGVLIPLVLALALFLLYKKTKKSSLEWASVTAGVVALGALVLRPFIPVLRDIESGWGIIGHSTISSLAMVWWLGVLGLTVFVVYRAFSSRFTSIAAAGLLVVGYVTLALMVLSPTMYESGARVAFVTDVLLICLNGILLSSLWRKANKVALNVVYILLGYSIANFMVLYEKFVTKFSIHQHF